MEWNRAQIQELEDAASIEAELDALLERVSQEPGEHRQDKHSQTPQPKTIPLDDVIVFNRSHLRVLERDPLYRDIFTYINSFAPEWISFDEIREALGVSHEKLPGMIEQLIELGILVSSSGGATTREKFKAAKSVFYFPDDRDFFQLRNQNVIQNAKAILDRLSLDQLKNKRAYRGLVTRELTVQQLEAVIEKTERLFNDICDLPESANPDRVYSVCLLVGERYSRKKPGLSPKPELNENRGSHAPSPQL